MVAMIYSGEEQRLTLMSKGALVGGDLCRFINSRVQSTVAFTIYHIA